MTTTWFTRCPLVPIPLAVGGRGGPSPPHRSLWDSVRGPHLIVTNTFVSLLSVGAGWPLSGQLG